MSAGMAAGCGLGGLTEPCQSWRELGAALIGGGGRIGPQHIRRIRQRLVQGDLPC